MILNKTLCILISGKAGVGKTTSAKYLQGYIESKYNLCGEIVPIASGVKAVAKTCFDWDMKKDSRGRRLLQSVGKIGRDYDADVWIKKAYDVMENVEYPFDFILVDDWRFPNEYKFLSEKGLLSVITIRLEAPNREILKGTPEANDVSETSLPSAEQAQDSIYNYTIDNSGELNHLYTELESLVDKEIARLKF